MNKLLFCIGMAGALMQQPAAAQNDLGILPTPRITGVPPSDAFIGLSRMGDGEIRHYNYGANPEEGKPLYLSSRDGGLTWKKTYLPYELPYADQCSPVSGEYIRLFCAHNKVYAMRTEGGLEGGRTITLIDNKAGIMNKPPVFIRNGGRIISGAHRTDRSGSFVYYSDDDGHTWKASAQVTVPPHVKGGFHQGVRWNHGAVEPTIVELKDGHLWMIMRTSQDKHYQSFSSDGGETWSEATPSPFYGTITMPTLYRLGDGRLLFFWCNTTPLPELPTANGVWDDVFTNRDVLHVAISEDDGKTWAGFRELLLNDERNSSSFGMTRPGEDKSVHQVQAVEVAPGKVLASAGQHKLCRKLVLFDVRWLYEKERTCDFSEGLYDWSAFRYYKGIVGHCCYNRQEAPLLINHPDDSLRKVMRIGYTPNDSLVNDADGALWNFPATRDGEVGLRIQLPEEAKPILLILNDRWFNPTDSVAAVEGLYVIPVSRKDLGIKDNRWHDVVVKWRENRHASVWVDKRKHLDIPYKNRTEHGVSYLHLLGGRIPDDTGVLIEKVYSSTTYSKE